MDVVFTIARDSRYLIDSALDTLVSSTCTGEVTEGVYTHKMTREEVEFIIEQLKKLRERDYLGLAFFEQKYEQAMKDADPDKDYINSYEDRIRYTKSDMYRIDQLLWDLRDAIRDAEEFDETLNEKKEEEA